MTSIPKPVEGVQPDAPRFGPIEAILHGDRAARTVRRRVVLTPRRFGVRARRDPQLLLAVSIAIPVLLMEAIAGPGARTLSIGVPIAFVSLQVVLSGVRSHARLLTVLRLALSLGFVVLANVVIDPTGEGTLSSLIVPVVALAAALGSDALLIAWIGTAITLAPVALPGVPDELRQRAVAIAMAAIVIAIGSRRVVATLERSTDRLRQARAREQRRWGRLATLEAVGRLLAREGPTAGALDEVMAILDLTFDYHYPSVYVWDGSALRLGAQRNYGSPIETFSPDDGVIGRVVRTRRPAFVPDVTVDPDYRAADAVIAGEISVPLLSNDELLGVLNVETANERHLTQEDLATMLIVGDRIAAAIALGRERQKLTERAALMERLTAMATDLNATLDPQTVHRSVLAGAARVIEADLLALVQLDHATGVFRTTAMTEGGEAFIGREIKPGEGVSGRAIATRTIAVDDHLERTRYPRMVENATSADVLAAMAAPMISAGVVVGALTWLREDLTKTFTPQEQEIAILLTGRITLALANAELHESARMAAATDALTGLSNRRHFDAAMVRAEAGRARLAPIERPARSVILFDLDHFGGINKRYGHQVGDQALREFGAVLRARTRASDLVARYGGEEFVVILEGATRDDAVRTAEAVRIAFAAVRIELPDGSEEAVTVSAGCASLSAAEVSGADLLARADVGLAMAKAAGRNQVVAA